MYVHELLKGKGFGVNTRLSLSLSICVRISSVVFSPPTSPHNGKDLGEHPFIVACF